MANSNGTKNCSYCGVKLDHLNKRGTCKGCNRAYCKGYRAGIRRAKKEADAVFDEFREAVLS